MTDKPRIDKAQIDQLYTAGILTEEAYQTAVARWQAQQISAGDRGVAAQSITDSQIATGDNSRNIRAETYIETLNQIIANADRADPASLRLAYLAQLYRQVGAVNLLGIDRGVSDERRPPLQLDAIYTALLTQQSESDLAELVDSPRHGQRPADGERRPLSAVAELNRHRRLVLLGEPGGGKSTFVNFVALCLAGEGLQRATGHPSPVTLADLTAPLPTDEQAEQDKEKAAVSQPWDQGPLLPVRVILRDFAARGLPAPGTPATAAHLWDFLCGEWAAAGLPDCQESLRKELLELGGLLLFDGLDEVPEADNRRGQLIAALEATAALFTRCRILVTCRTYAYQQQAWRLNGFTTTLLAPLTAAQIRLFVDRWYAQGNQPRALSAEDAQGRAELLKHAIFASDRLRVLAERPLLLTLMASLHAWHGGTLPDRREQLYAEAVELLLDRWERSRLVRRADGSYEVIQPSLAEYLKVEREELQAVLNRLAYEIHAAQPAAELGVANLAEGTLINALVAISRNAQVNPLLLVDYLSQRAGLLVGHGVGLYSFPHRTFQEYLAACYLAGQDSYPEALAELARRDPNRWREVALLAGARVAHVARSSLWLLIDALCYRWPTHAKYAVADSWGALLAAQALVETVDLAKIGPQNEEKVDRVRQGLLHLLRDHELPALERARAGQFLAKLGDPRPEVLTVEATEFCFVPAGPFIMGDGKERYTNETLNYAYWLGRYPVTNAQFEQFMEAGGYGDQTYWPEAINEKFWTKQGFKGRLDSQPRRGPNRYRAPFHLPNHPVIGVTWYEALAFTRWLTRQAHQQDWLPLTWQITLPSEAEWEKGARGGVQILAAPHIGSWPAVAARADGAPTPADKLIANPWPDRTYPWGNDADPDLSNQAESEIGTTSAVGAFIKGAGPYGGEELSGNMWEWTRSLYKPYPYRSEDGREALTAGYSDYRVLRGGSYSRGAAGCARRYWYGPSVRDAYRGFRIVASPSTSDL